jgi:exodeoxyribonuclease VII small subunit
MPRSPASPPSTPSAGSLPDEPSSYESALGELESLVSAMESAALPLDRLLESYRRASSLLTYCRGRLAAVESQVKVLEDGQLKTWVAEN